MSIGKGAFGQSAKGSFIESAMGARGWGGSFPIFTTGVTSAFLATGSGMRNLTDNGTGFDTAWINQSGNYSSLVQYDADNVLFSFLSGAAEPGRLRMTDYAGTTVWTRQISESANGSIIAGFLRGDKVFYRYIDKTTAIANLRAVDRATGATVQWTLALTHNPKFPFGFLGKGFYVDSNQDTYILYAYEQNNTGLPERGDHVRLVKVNSSGTLVSDTSIYYFPFAAGVYPYTNYDLASAVQSSYLLPVGNDFVIGAIESITVGSPPPYPNMTRNVLRFTKAGAVVYDVPQNVPNEAFPGEIIFQAAGNGKLYARLDEATVQWFNAATGALVDSMTTPLNNNRDAAMAVTEVANEIYLVGRRKAASIYDIARLNTTTKTLTWEDEILAGATQASIVSRPWPS